MLPDKVYNILKWIAIVFFPATGTLIFTLSQIWGWSWGEAVLGTIAALGTFLGALLGVSTVQYRKAQNEDKPTDN